MSDIHGVGGSVSPGLRMHDVRGLDSTTRVERAAFVLSEHAQRLEELAWQRHQRSMGSQAHQSDLTAGSHQWDAWIGGALGLVGLLASCVGLFCPERIAETCKAVSRFSEGVSQVRTSFSQANRTRYEQQRQELHQLQQMLQQRESFYRTQANWPHQLIQLLHRQN